MKGYCIKCGFLKFKRGKIHHPELDKIYAEILKSGATTTYTNENPVFDERAIENAKHFVNVKP